MVRHVDMRIAVSMSLVKIRHHHHHHIENETCSCHNITTIAFNDVKQQSLTLSNVEFLLSFAALVLVLVHVLAVWIDLSNARGNIHRYCGLV